MQAKDDLNLEHWGLGFKRVYLKLALHFRIILLVFKPLAFCWDPFFTSVKSLLICQTQTDPDRCHSSLAFSELRSNESVMQAMTMLRDPQAVIQNQGLR